MAFVTDAALIESWQRLSSSSEVAAELGITPNTVTSRIRRLHERGVKNLKGMTNTPGSRSKVDVAALSNLAAEHRPEDAIDYQPTVRPPRGKAPMEAPPEALESAPPPAEVAATAPAAKPPAKPRTPKK